jgi:hypothetical protein
MKKGSGPFSVFLALLAAVPLPGHAASIASGKHWRLSIDSLACEGAYSPLVLGAQIRYLGPKGPVEAPVIRLVGADAQPILPRSLVWVRGSKQHAAWLTSGGVASLQFEEIGDVQLRFDISGASGGLQLEFGDIPAFSLSAGGCERLLKPDAIRAPRARASKGAKTDMRVYRASYPCLPRPGGPARTVEAQYPPHAPKQLLLFGRGYLPSTRQVDLPMGRAPAQAYAYNGPDALEPIEQAARAALATDFPEYLRPAKYFAFNWGTQKGAANIVDSIGIYELRPCAP